MHLRVKPFTLFLCFLLIAFLILGPPFLWAGLKKREPLDFLLPQKPKWTGMIRLWDVPYVETGTGSRISWLKTRIRDFEKKYPGVFVDIRPMTSQRVKMYFQGDVEREFLPDIISLELYEEIIPEGMLEDLSFALDEEKIKGLHSLAQKRIVKNGKIIGIPWMMGGYGFFINQDLVMKRNVIIPEDQEWDYEALGQVVQATTYQETQRKKKIPYYGFCSYSTPYSRPLYCMFYHQGGKIQDDMGYQAFIKWVRDLKAAPAHLFSLSYADAWKLFGEQQAGLMLGNTRVLYDLRKLQDSGKGFQFRVTAVPLSGKEGLFMDQVAAFGILKQEDPEKLKICAELLLSLLNEDAQISLKELGVFPVITGVDPIYVDDPEMGILERMLKNCLYGPDEADFPGFRQALQEALARDLSNDGQ